MGKPVAECGGCPLTAFDKIWESHLVRRLDDGRELIFVDRHVLQETTSARAFDRLRAANRPIRHPELTLATQDHIISTELGRTEDTNPGGRELVALMRTNAAAAGIRHFGAGSHRQGIVHVIAPELAFALPGSIVACGDSHTSTVGGIGALGLGVGTSDVEHVLATQTLALDRPRNMRISFEGETGRGITSKDMILRAIGAFGVAAGRGSAIEYAGSAVRRLAVEARLTMCNMSVEIGARVGLIAPDDTAISYIEGREFAPGGKDFEDAARYWRSLRSDEDAEFAVDLLLDCTGMAPQVTWGTTPEDVVDIDGRIPDPASYRTAHRRDRAASSLRYMGLEPGQRLAGLPLDVVFIGSCTNSRIDDLEAAAAIVKGRKVARGLRALVVPGSSAVKGEAERRGLDRIFTQAGFEWREAGCSMCVSINEDVVPPGARSLATSNRNFAHRQGPGSRTHLASPLTAAASAVAGAIWDPREVDVQ